MMIEFGEKYIDELKKLNDIINNYIDYVKTNDSNISPGEWYENQTYWKGVDMYEDFINILDFLDEIDDVECGFSEEVIDRIKSDKKLVHFLSDEEDV